MEGKVVKTEITQGITVLAVDIEGARMRLHCFRALPNRLSNPVGGADELADTLPGLRCFCSDQTGRSLASGGASSTLFISDENAPDGGQWPYQYLNSYGMTIAAGTSEIQRNQLGERILGMPESV